jgi:hypothetical protein
LFYGGQAGGGKTMLLIGLSLTAHNKSLVLRRTNVECAKLVEEYAERLGTREGWNGQRGFWHHDNRLIEIRGCQHEDDKQKFKGGGRDLIGFDEITDFTETQFRFIKGWNRTAEKGQRVRVICTGNPPTRPEGFWVKNYWGAWLDKNHPKYPTPEGQLRWYTTIAGKDEEVDGPGPHIIPGETKPVTARSRTFIRARLEDNPDLEEQGYDSVLAGHPDVLRRAYRDGSFDIEFEDDDWQVIPTAWIDAAQERWTADGYKGLSMTAMGIDPSGGGKDATVAAARYGTWYAPMITAKGEETADGSAMAGMIMRHRRDSCPIVIDVGGGYAGGMIVRLKDNAIAYHKFDGGGSSMASAQGSGLKFANKRAEAWWRFREALDPDQEGGSPVVLPPDTELRVDLASARYDLGPKGIILEAKDKIRARIGRSPDKGDAVVMCLSEGNKAAVRRLNSLGRIPKVIHYSKRRSRRRCRKSPGCLSRLIRKFRKR